jgi:hypothetical protein
MGLEKSNKLLTENLQKMESENKVLNDIVKKHCGQHVTLNVSESTTNFSLFNLFKKDQKSCQETKKFEVSIENQDITKKQTNFNVYNGSFVDRPSDVLFEATLKKPQGLSLKNKVGRKDFQSNLKVDTFELREGQEDCVTPE